MPLPQVFSLLVLGQGSSGLDVVQWACSHLGDRVSGVTMYGGAKAQPNDRTRELERAGVAYTVNTYEIDVEGDRELGVHIAEQLGEDPDQGFKTLVTTTPTGDHVVCCIPVAEELDFKAAALAAEVSHYDARSRALGRYGLCARRLLPCGYEEEVRNADRRFVPAL